MYNILNKENKLDLDKTIIDKWINKYESWLEKYPDEEKLDTKMNKYAKGFFDKWTSLRNLRNDIIHSNTTYVSKIKMSKINKMIDESFLVFANLKSEIYKNS